VHKTKVGATARSAIWP